MNDWQQQLDRLVDGELSPEAYRGLLAELETRPHGWRDCALAFLEAQALRGEVSAITQADRVPPIITQIAVKTPVKWWSPPIMGLLSLAATLLFVFMAEQRLSQWFTNPAPNPNNIVNNSDASPQELVEPVGQLSFAVQEPNQSARTYEVPVFEEAGLVSTNWTLPNACEQALQNAGHRVVREQNIVPVDLPDGRQVVVPVERVRVIPMMSAEVY